MQNNFERQVTDDKEPNYALRRTGAAALVGLMGLGAIGAVKGYSVASERTPVGSSTETVISGDNNTDPVWRAINQIQAEHPEADFNPSQETINRVASELGIIHPGDQIEVHGESGSTIDNIFGDGDYIEVGFTQTD